MNNNNSKNGPVKRLAIVLDKSGSMSSCRAETVEGVNKFLASIRDETPDTLVSVNIFDTRVHALAKNKPIMDIPDMPLSAYRPGGATALYDAVGATVKAVDEQAGKDDDIVFAVLTDGLENSSTKYSQRDIFTMIQERQTGGRWTFFFLGADQDAWASAESIGIHRGNSIGYSKRDMVSTLDKAGRLSARYAKMKESGHSPSTASFFAGSSDMKDVDPDSPDWESNWTSSPNSPQK